MGIWQAMAGVGIPRSNAIHPPTPLGILAEGALRRRAMLLVRAVLLTGIDQA
jgi:hypothetical protein